MPTLRKIPCALARFLRPVPLLVLALALSAAFATVPSGALAKPKDRPTTAHLSQAGRDLILSVRTSKPLALGTLQPRPDTRRAAARYLCFGFASSSSAGDAAGEERRLCVGGPKAHTRAGLVTVDAAEKPTARSAVAAKLKRPDPDKLVLTLDPAAAGLTPGHYSWRVLESGGCQVRRKCAAALPAKGGLAFRLRPVRAVGCSGGSGGLITNGPREGSDVALTFDDGPSEYTDRYLDVLKEKGVHATFFEIGQEMPGREATMRRILGEGDEIGDHTMNHVEYPGYSQIAGAQTRIEQYTGFKPCLFRPPGGAVNSSVVSTAAGLGMDTITWDVDPQDWSLPGTDAIYSNIVGNAQAGSIILMHDGGGPRDETLAALPHIIDTLRAKGYGFETVSALLGNEIVYRPYG